MVLPQGKIQAKSESLGQNIYLGRTYPPIGLAPAVCGKIDY
ncbi:MAG TPA: hypothetical protein P5267_02895 [Patescibacteria group bacterium]|nr:hypothetical protein [Patescibacteria group bacterium]